MQALVFLLIVGVVVALKLFHSLLFQRPVLRPDLLSALEGHVLKHVSQAGEPARVIYSPYVDISVKSDDGCIMTFKNNEVHTIRQTEFRDFLLEVVKRLGKKGSGENCRE